MDTKCLLSALAIVAVSATAGNALTISNQDDVDYILEMVEGVGDAGVETIALEASQVIDDICNTGCTITLNNGESHSFLGDEWVTIEDGQFVLPE